MSDPAGNLLLFGLAAAVVWIASTRLAVFADAIALQSGLGFSFVGVTSLPELSTTIAAVRIGAFTMAIANIFGSNLIMVAFLFPADAFYAGGRILEQVDRTEKFALETTLRVIQFLR